MGRSTTTKKGTKSEPGREKSAAAAGYLEQSARLAASIVFIAPLLLIYEVGIVLARSRVRSGAEVMLKAPLSLLGARGMLAFNLLVLVGFFAAYWYAAKRKQLSGSVFLGMLLESVLYAAVFGSAVRYALRGLEAVRLAALPAPGGERAVDLILSVGAGVYEELLFRLILAGGLFYLLKKGLGLWTVLSGVLSVGISAALFAFAHYMGPEAFSWDSFRFRLVAGLLLSCLFLTRGLGVAVYTHAAYDILVVMCAPYF